MKKILKISALFLVLAATFSCEDDEIPTANMITPENGPVLITPQAGTSIVLSPDLMENPALTLAWEDAAYSVQTPITYNVEFAEAGTDFASPIVIATTTQKTVTWSVEQLNGFAIDPDGLNLTPFEENEFDVRVVSSVGDGNAVAMASNAITITVTPYTTDNPVLYVIGNFLNASGYGADWSPAATLPFLEASAYGKTDFEGYVYLNVTSGNPEYKYLPTNTSFDGDWGDDGSFAGGLAQEGESNIVASAPGYYFLKANTGVVSASNPDGLTYSALQTNWGLIGNGTPTGWDSDTDMTYDPATKKWTIEIMLTSGLKMKFRANDGWDHNLGDTDPDGILNFGGADIDTPATSGMYKVELDLSHPRNYTYTVTAL